MPNKSALGLDENIAALLCYVNVCLPIGLIVSIIVLVQDKNNKLPRFHAVQSLILTVIATILGVGIWIAFIVGNIIDAMIMIATGLPIPIFTLLLSLIFGILFLAIFIGIIISAVKAFQGQIFKFPIIGGFADKFSN